MKKCEKCGKTKAIIPLCAVAVVAVIVIVVVTICLSVNKSKFKREYECISG
jgi:hypothetical protein